MSNKVDTVDHIQILYKITIVFLLDIYGARHERNARKALIDTIPHTLTASDRDNAAFDLKQDIDKSGLKIDLW